MHHHHMHVAKGVEDSDLAMSKDMVFYTLSEKNGVISLVTAEKYSAKKQTGLCPGERSWYFYIFIHIQ